MAWEVAANIATVITGLSIIIALIQLVRESRKQNIEAFFYLHEYLSKDEFSDARKRVRKELYKKPYAEWTEDDKTKASEVCSSYDQAGILIQAGIIKKEAEAGFLGSSWGQSILDQYESLAPFLDDMQTPRQTGREFFRHFTWLYNETKKYQGDANEKNSKN